MCKTKNNYEHYREILTEEEAKQFQKENYQDYCNEYFNKKNKMRKYGYAYRIGLMKDHIELYLGEQYKSINQYMRNGYTENIDAKNLDAMIDRINELIICAPRINEDIVIYRGVDKDAIEDILNEMNQETDIYTEKGFMSASLRFETVLREYPSCQYIMKIYVSKGASALGVDCINDRGEEELLFPEKQYLRFINKKYKKSGKTIYEFELISF